MSALSTDLNLSRLTVNINVPWAFFGTAVMTYIAWDEGAHLLGKWLDKSIAAKTITMIALSAVSIYAPITTLVLVSIVCCSVLSTEKEKPPAEVKAPPVEEKLPYNIVDLAKEALKGGKSYYIDPLTLRKLEAVLNVQGECNSPVLVGPAGCGKTSTVLALASQIAKDELRDNSPLKGRRIYMAKFSDIMSGFGAELHGIAATSYREGIASALCKVINFIKTKPGAILFLDEIHLMMDGNAARIGSAEHPAQLLKQEIDRGQLTIIGATTDDEYKLIEKDPAVARRFPQVPLSEPNESQCIDILKVKREELEKAYKITFDDNVIVGVTCFAKKYQKKTLPAGASLLLSQFVSYAATLDERPACLGVEELVDYLVTQGHTKAGRNYICSLMENWIENQSFDDELLL